MIRTMTGNTVEKKEQEEQLAEKRETRKKEKDILHTHEVRIIGNDVQGLAEKLLAVSALSKNSAVSIWLRI